MSRALAQTPGAARARQRILVYRHRLAPLSEVGFLGRFYLGFERLEPVWAGCRIEPGALLLTAEPLRIGRSGPLGTLDRALFKEFGVLPPRPDLKALAPRLVHAHFGRGGALALPIARALGIPLVVTFLGGDATKEKHYRRRLVPPVFARRLTRLQQEAALFVCVSEFIRKRLIERGFPPEKLEVIHQGVTIEEGEPQRPAAAAAEDPYILFAGRFVEKKGATHLIEAMRILEGRGCEAGLVLVGDGPLRVALEEEARGLKRVSFPGWLPAADLHGWMRGALALSVPSVTARSGDSEGLPNVLVEAMAQGVPVVGSREAGIPEAVEHEKTGLLVPPGDPRALADALQVLIERPEERRRLGVAARAAAAARFEAGQQSRRLEAALLRVLEKAASGPSKEAAR